MIKWLDKLRTKKLPDPVELPKPFVADGIYHQLQMAIGQLYSVQLNLKAGSVALGRIENYNDTLEDFLNMLIEVNNELTKKEYIEKALFYNKDVKLVRLDRFLFVRNDHYVKDAPDLLQKVLEQVDVYFEHMKQADKALHGKMEHNHRQLYRFTMTIIQFLNSIFDHFGQ